MLLSLGWQLYRSTLYELTNFETAAQHFNHYTTGIEIDEKECDKEIDKQLCLQQSGLDYLNYSYNLFQAIQNIIFRNNPL